MSHHDQVIPAESCCGRLRPVVICLATAVLALLGATAALGTPMYFRGNANWFAPTSPGQTDSTGNNTMNQVKAFCSMQQYVNTVCGAVTGSPRMRAGMWNANTTTEYGGANGDDLAFFQTSGGLFQYKRAFCRNRLASGIFNMNCTWNPNS